MSDETLVDARGHRCPVPTLRLRRATESAAPGQLIRLLADDPMAKIDVPHYAAKANLQVLEAVSEGSLFSILLRRPV